MTIYADFFFSPNCFLTQFPSSILVIILASSFLASTVILHAPRAIFFRFSPLFHLLPPLVLLSVHTFEKESSTILIRYFSTTLEAGKQDRTVISNSISNVFFKTIVYYLLYEYIYSALCIHNHKFFFT